VNNAGERARGDGGGAEPGDDEHLGRLADPEEQHHHVEEHHRVQLGREVEQRQERPPEPRPGPGEQEPQRRAQRHRRREAAQRPAGAEGGVVRELARAP